MSPLHLILLRRLDGLYLCARLLGSGSPSGAPRLLGSGSPSGGMRGKRCSSAVGPSCRETLIVSAQTKLGHLQGRKRIKLGVCATLGKPTLTVQANLKLLRESRILLRDARTLSSGSAESLAGESERTGDSDWLCLQFLS